MAEFPIDKYLAQDYRNTLRTFEAPQNIDTKNPLIPVIDIQKGFPKPNSKQTLKKKIFYDTGGTTQTNTLIATPSSSLKVYYLGCQLAMNGTGSSQTTIFEGAAADTTTDGGESTLFNSGGVASNMQDKFMEALPIELKDPLRITQTSAATNTVWCIVFYIEEVV